METTVHEKSLALLRIAPDQSALSEVAQFEEIRDLRLPAAVRQFYASPTLVALLNPSGGDHIVALNKLKIQKIGGRNVLEFLVENQGVFVWSVELIGDDDPPVSVRQWVEPHGWHHCCDSFSTFVFGRAFDNQLWKCEKGKLVNCAVENFKKLSSGDLIFLNTNFQEVPRTFGLPCVIYRFWDGWEKRISIWDADYGVTLTIATSDENNFNALLRKLESRWDFSLAV